VSLRCVVAFGLALVLNCGLHAAERKRPATIKDLESRPVEVRRNTGVDASVAKAMENYRRFLELQHSDPELRAEALRRLGDLSLESGELERMEKEVTQLDLAGGEAIRLYTSLLKAYPNYPRNDEVLYQLARAYETTGQPEQALATLDRIARAYPASPQLAEVQFRRGELLFSARRYAEAERAYASVVDDETRSAFFEQSLYKHGWSLFKQGRSEDCLPSFARVLDQKLLKRDRAAARPETLARADRELVEDTLRVMSITFSYLDGAESLDRFVARRGTSSYSHLLYSRLGDLYVEKQRFQDAASTYRAYAARDPHGDYAPNLSMQAIEAYEKGGFTRLVLEGKLEYVERYNFSTPFWQARKRADHPRVVEELKTNLKDVATHFHATAQKSKRIEDYTRSARWYRDYLASFPDDPESAGTNYLLAETLFESRNFADAATEFERTAYQYPRNPKSAAAGYAALVAYERENARLQGAARTALQTRSTEAGIRFAESFPEHPESAGVLTRAAQDVFAAKDLPRAIQLAEAIIARRPPVDVPKQRIAWTIIGQSRFDLTAFADAERAWLRARELATDDAKMHADLTERIAESVYRQAETKRNAGDALGAVDDFLRVARVAPTSKIRAAAEYDAAAQLLTLNQWDRAITVLEAFRRDHPTNELAAEVTRKLAVAYTEAGRPGEAASEFERLASSPKESEAVQREALLQAADLHGRAGNAQKTMAMLESFVARFPAPVGQSIEARQRLAELSAKSGDAREEQRWLRDIVQADGAAGAARTDRTRSLAARAQLALAQPARDAFREVRLVAPLKKSLVDKRKALETAMQGYKAAASYGIAEVTTAATYEMAELYRTLGRDIMESERPKKLTADALEQYDLLLEEQAFPFEEQAIGMHEVNTALARDGVYDESVKRSFRALAELKPARYGKTEMMQDVVAVPN
jgi:cellulose synthase operon protein C